MKNLKYLKDEDKSKGHEKVAAQWDRVCESRVRLIQEGKDFSLTNITTPCMVHFFRRCKPKNVLDIGCGTGYLTNKLACEQFEGTRYAKITGIDLSPRSIELAKKLYTSDNLHFECAELQKYRSPKKYDMCIANMVLMSEPDLVGFLESTRRIITEDGHFLIMISHPCFWPRYWGYEDERGFDYCKEISMEARLLMLSGGLSGDVTHIHRSLTDYCSAIDSAGFVIEKIREPYPEGPVPEKYKTLYPRFLFFMCKAKEV